MLIESYLSLLTIVFQAAPAEVDPLLDIGAEDGDPAIVLGDIADAALGPDGTVFVLDRSDSRVRTFDASGQPSGTFGRAGDGPGELRGPVRIEVTGATVSVTANGILTQFSLSGELVATRRFEISGIVQAMALDDSTFVTLKNGVVTTRGSDREQVVAVWSESSASMIETGLSGTDVFIALPGGNFVLDAGLCATLAVGYLDSHHFVVGNGQSGRITVYRGVNPVKSFEVASPAKALDQDEADRIMALARRSRAGSSPSAKVTLPPFESTICGVEREAVDAVWVRLPDESAGTEVWQPLSLTTGTLGGRVEFPPGMEVLAFSGGRAVARWVTERGVPKVTVFRVPQA